MATCTLDTGILLWKKPCGLEAIGNCRQCLRFVCQRHGAAFADGTLLCSMCASQTEDSTGTVFTTAPLVAGAAAAHAAGEQRAPDSWHGADAESDAGFDPGGDSGGDSGGSAD